MESVTLPDDYHRRRNIAVMGSLCPLPLTTFTINGCSPESPNA
jgi:hypothetical protein